MADEQLAADLALVPVALRAVAAALPGAYGAVNKADVSAAIAAAAEALAATPQHSAVVSAQITAALAALTGLAGGSPSPASVEAALEMTRFGELPGSVEAGDFVGTIKALPSTTATRRRQTAARAALVHLVRRLACAAAARAALAIAYASQEEAAATRERLLARLDDISDQAGDAGDDEAYLALGRLRAAVFRALTARASGLARLRSYQSPPGPAPALVLAYDLYDDLGREAEIVAMNNIRHPGLPPGEATLTVREA